MSDDAIEVIKANFKEMNSKFGDEEVEEIHTRVGGLPQEPKPPLDYSLIFSVQGLTNEYIEIAEVIRESKLEKVKPLTEIEEIVFPEPFGAL